MKKLESTYTAKFAKDRFDVNRQWLLPNLVFEGIVGSHSYGCFTEDSDYDIIGLVMDEHKSLFPQSYGYILGFDNLPKFENTEEKGIDKRIKLDNGKMCEGEWHSLTNYFRLVCNGSPSLTELLFVRTPEISFSNKVGYMLRDNRKLFLSMAMFHSLKGYCFQQLTRLKKGVVAWNRDQKCDNNTRKHYFETVGYDCKMAYHCLRLLDLIDQLIKLGDLDLMRNREECKVMRAGEWGSWDKFEKYVGDKLKDLESYTLTNTVAIPNRPQREPLHELLKNCIEEWHGFEVKQNQEFVSAKSVMDRLDNIEKLILKDKK